MGALGGGIVALIDPVVVGIIGKAPFPQGACHNVQVVHLIAIGRAAGVVAFGDQGDVMIVDGQGFIQTAIFRVNALNPKALGMSLDKLNPKLEGIALPKPQTFQLNTPAKLIKGSGS